MGQQNNTRIVAMIAWTLFYLAVIDIGVNALFRYPADPRNTHPGALRSYFEYGRSVEGKLERMTRETNDQSAPIISFGWLMAEPDRSEECRPRESGKTVVAVYGMSHAQMLGEAILKVSSAYVVRNITAPGAVPAWTFAASEQDMDSCKPDVAIFGVMTDSVPLISATSGATAYFDMSYPYTFPRYTLNEGKLHAVYPPFLSVGSYRDYFYNRAKWAEYRTWLKKHDPFYDPLLFKMTHFDDSSIVRIVRRAYFEFRRKERVDKVYGKEGFNEKSDQVTVLRAMIKEFARYAEERGIMPIIYVVNNQGRSDHLYKVLKPVLDDNKIPFFSTHIVCPPDDPRLFLANSHFTPEKDLEIAGEVIKIIQSRRSRSVNRLSSHVQDGS